LVNSTFIIVSQLSSHRDYTVANAAP